MSDNDDFRAGGEEDESVGEEQTSTSKTSRGMKSKKRISSKYTLILCNSSRFVYIGTSIERWKVDCHISRPLKEVICPSISEINDTIDSCSHTSNVDVQINTTTATI